MHHLKVRRGLWQTSAGMLCFYKKAKNLKILWRADLSHPTIDLSLKTRALFFSQQPFDVCREAISLPASQGELCMVQYAASAAMNILSWSLPCMQALPAIQCQLHQLLRRSHGHVLVVHNIHSRCCFTQVLNGCVLCAQHHQQSLALLVAARCPTTWLSACSVR